MTLDISTLKSKLDVELGAMRRNRRSGDWRAHAAAADMYRARLRELEDMVIAEQRAMRRTEA